MNTQHRSASWLRSAPSFDSMSAKGEGASRRSVRRFRSGLGTTLALTLFAAVALITSAPRAAAQANANPPGLMTYQGYLVDANGNPLGTNAPKNYDVIFRVFPAATGGAVLWAEQQTVTVDKGYFSVLLGEGSSIGEPRPALNTVFTNATASERWIGMTVKGIGTGGSDANILPRLRLLTSPYSFLSQRAISAASVDGAAVNSGTVADARLSSNVALRNGGNTFSGNQIFVNSVGIGTSIPETALQIGSYSPGDQYLSVTTSGGNQYRAGVRLRHFSSAYGWTIESDERSASYPLNFVNHFASAAGAPRVTFTGGGNVGIGTTAPGARLHIVDSTIPSARIESSSTVGTWLALGNSSAGGRYWQMISTGSANGGGAGKMLITSGAIPNSTDANPMTLQTDGNVGLGTTTPVDRLHLRGGALRIDDAGNEYIRFYRSANGLIITGNGMGNAGGGGVGTAQWDGDGNWDSLSDRRLKKDIQDAEPVLDRVMKLPVRRYRWKADADDAPTRFGVIAQEVESLFAESVGELVNPEDNEKSMTVKYSTFGLIAIKALQEMKQQQDAELAKLRAEIDELKQANKERDARLAALERLITAQQVQTAGLKSSSERNGN